MDWQKQARRWLQELPAHVAVNQIIGQITRRFYGFGPRSGSHTLVSGPLALFWSATEGAQILGDLLDTQEGRTVIDYHNGLLLDRYAGRLQAVAGAVNRQLLLLDIDVDEGSELTFGVGLFTQPWNDRAQVEEDLSLPCDEVDALLTDRGYAAGEWEAFRHTGDVDCVFAAAALRRGEGGERNASAGGRDSGGATGTTGDDGGETLPAGEDGFLGPGLKRAAHRRRLREAISGIVRHGDEAVCVGLRSKDTGDDDTGGQEYLVIVRLDV